MDEKRTNTPQAGGETSTNTTGLGIRPVIDHAGLASPVHAVTRPLPTSQPIAGPVETRVMYLTGWRLDRRIVLYDYYTTPAYGIAHTATTKPGQDWRDFVRESSAPDSQERDGPY